MFGIKQLLLILGVVVILRLIGKFMTARKNISEQESYKKGKASQEAQAKKSKEQLGKTTIQKIDKRSIEDSDYADFEEIN
jgi:hypothetical protein